MRFYIWHWEHNYLPSIHKFVGTSFRYLLIGQHRSQFQSFASMITAKFALAARLCSATKWSKCATLIPPSLGRSLQTVHTFADRPVLVSNNVADSIIIRPVSSWEKTTSMWFMWTVFDSSPSSTVYNLIIRKFKSVSDDYRQQPPQFANKFSSIFSKRKIFEAWNKSNSSTVAKFEDCVRRYGPVQGYLKSN